MRLMLFLVGLLVLLGGLLPLINDAGLMPESLEFVPTSGVIYQLIIVGIGAFAIYFAVKHSRRF